MPTTPTLPGAPPDALVIPRKDGTWFDAGLGTLCGIMSSDGYMLGLSNSVDRPTLYPGDYVQMYQSIDLSGQDIISLAAAITGLVVPAGLEQPGYLSPSDTLLHYRMDEVSEGARDELHWEHDMRPRDGDIGISVPTYNGGYGLARTWGTGAGRLIGYNDPQVIVPLTGLSEYTLDWYQNFDIDSIATSDDVTPVIFQLRSRTAGGFRVRWLGSAGFGAHAWRLQLEHWDVGGYAISSLLATLRATNQGDEFISVAWDDVTMAARVYINGVDMGGIGPLAVLPGQPLLDAEIIIGDPLYRGMIDDVRLSETKHSLADHQADYLLRLDPPAPYGCSWWLHIRIDGEDYASCKINPDASGRPVYLNAPVRMLPAGTHMVYARLSLEAGA